MCKFKIDMYAEDSIALLRNCGINFERHKQDGIEPNTFAYMLITSGVVLDTQPRVNWITFHSGYDFCYLLKVILTSLSQKNQNPGDQDRNPVSSNPENP